MSFVHDLAVAELHDADGKCGLPLVEDGVFGDPEIGAAEHAPDFEAGWLAGVMTAQGLEIGAAEDALAGLRIVADSVVGVDGMLGVGVAGGRGLPVRVEGFADLVVVHRLLSRLA